MAHGSLSQFKATLERKKAREDKRRKTFESCNQYFKVLDEQTEYNFPELSEVELETVKQNIRDRLQTQKKKKQFIVISIVVFLVLIIVYLAV